MVPLHLVLEFSLSPCADDMFDVKNWVLSVAGDRWKVEMHIRFLGGHLDEFFTRKGAMHLLSLF